MAVAMSTITKKLSYEEWLALPETKQRYEIVDGVMYMPPSPNGEHQWVAQQVFLKGSNFAFDNHTGVFMMAPFDIMVQREPLRVRQPDIMYLNSGRTGIRGIAQLRGVNFLEVAPDVVMEVLSPSNTRRELDAKLRDYQQIGVYQCWVFSPEAETAEIVDLTGSEPKSVAVFGVEETLRSDLLPGFELSLQGVFR